MREDAMDIDMLELDTFVPRQLFGRLEYKTKTTKTL
jgi:hypothetical protein